MSELRQNIATRDWVIIAPERSNRPEDFADHNGNHQPREDHTRCPFCPGNEHDAPEEVGAICAADGSWLVRAVTNKYPALSRHGDLVYREQGVQRWISGVGVHDVIVETPQHDSTIALLDEAQVGLVMQLYKQRNLAAMEDERVELVTLFKNHGPSAGTSLEHPHSQLIGTPVVPADLRQRINIAMSYFDDHRCCVYCSMLEEELQSGARIVAESEHFAAFVLYAALSPFHMWILPKQHRSAFFDLPDDELADLARVLRTVLRKLYFGLNDPDYNFMIRSRPKGVRSTPFFHWQLSVVPRVSTNAGFELGSGMFINTVLPEMAAAFLRDVKD